MKTEDRTIEVQHPTAGLIEKINRYTWDEKIYPTWEEAMAVGSDGSGFIMLEFIKKIN